MENNNGINKTVVGVHSAIDRALDIASDATDEAGRKTREVIERATHTAHQTVDKAAAQARPAAAWLSNKADAVMAGQKQLVDDGRTAVINHPWKAVGIALAVGFLVSRLTR
jgi:ElaB/YqjD/DUF883 family membrane-anchored ribosome-binding protein